MVFLEKDQRLSLARVGSSQLTRIRMGLGWDAAKRTGLLGLVGVRPKPVDLDAACLMYDGDELIDRVWYRQLGSLDGSVRHTGDNLTGEGNGDDESIVVDLTVIPDWISTLIFVVTSYSGQDFSQVERAHCRLVDLSGKASAEIMNFDLSASGQHRSLVMAKMEREESTWSIYTIGAPSAAATIDELAVQARAYL